MTVYTNDSSRKPTCREHPAYPIHLLMRFDSRASANFAVRQTGLNSNQGQDTIAIAHHQSCTASGGTVQIGNLNDPYGGLGGSLLPTGLVAARSSAGRTRLSSATNGSIGTLIDCAIMVMVRKPSP